jgi:SAM-dependent methyltransferase
VISKIAFAVCAARFRDVGGAELCSVGNVKNARPGWVSGVGKRLPAQSSALRPRPVAELREWGGLGLVRGKRLLDLGCGDGRFALGVARYASTVNGIDPDAQAVADARKLARKNGMSNARFAVGAGQRLPFPDDAFDVVVLSWTL